MPVGSPLSTAQKRELERKELLEKRRNPAKGKLTPFKPRLMRWPIEVYTEMPEQFGKETEPGRDLQFKVDALTSIEAARMVLDALQATFRPGEMVHGIHIGTPGWLPREPRGRVE